jgi:hypothetical protein
MKAKQGLSLKDLVFIEKVYKSCKTVEHRESYFAWEERLFKRITVPSIHKDGFFIKKAK